MRTVAALWDTCRRSLPTGRTLPMLLHTAQGLSLLRIAFGWYFIISALRKTSGGWLQSGDQVTAFIDSHLEAATPFYRGFLESIVLPNADLFAQLVMVG